MKRPAPPLAAALLLLCLFFALPAQTATAKDVWTSVRSKNFFLIGNAAEKDVRQVATRLEQFRYVFSQLFPKANLASPVATTVVVFKSDAAYTPFKPLYNGKTSKWVAGYFQPGDDVNYITLTSEKHGEDNPYATIFHEYAHLIVNNNIGDPPVWFNEGLAEYYSTFEVSDGDKKITLGIPVRNHVYLLRERFMPLEDLLRVTHGSPAYNESDKNGVFYAESWALVHYLLQGNKGQRVAQLGRFSSLVAAGKPVEESFQQAFQTDFKTMERELRAYVKNSTYQVQVFDLPKPLVFDAEMTTTPLSEGEAQGHLGDLLLHTNRLDDAEARLKQALALAPDSAQAHASLGMLRVRQGKFDEAAAELKRAVEGNSQNYLAHYYYADAIFRKTVGEGRVVTSFPAEDARVMRAELRRAIELNPSFAQSYYQLAFVSLETGEGLDEATRLLAQARRLEPNRHAYALLLAQIHMRRQEYAAARQLLEPVSRSATAETHERGEAQSMLATIQMIEDQIAKHGKDSVVFGGAGGGAAGGGAGGVQTAVTTTVENMKPTIKRRTNGEQVRGALTRIDCPGGSVVVFNVRVGDRTLRLRAASFERVEFMSYVPTMAGAALECGLRKPENLVYVTFRRATEPKPKFDGELLAVDFVTPDIELEPEP
ncbi:MAG: tetratricopeptide repeat protein [Acidobacteria bacterium]|nr:tetratricopeptide repeat protein [Acidobacteriota bacterium]